mmetsp:Transcript_13692/g.33167  ORF Transcript_13692/g.33167 Transcript_13692/m.33167 type:complete len:123 (-) Transcript_13692:1561-1929(-)
MTAAPGGPDRASKYPELPLMLRGCSCAGIVVGGGGVVVVAVAAVAAVVAAAAAAVAVVAAADDTVVGDGAAAATGGGGTYSAVGAEYKLVCEVTPAGFFPNGEYEDGTPAEVPVPYEPNTSR